jgi:hypothetical protein
MCIGAKRLFQIASALLAFSCCSGCYEDGSEAPDHPLSPTPRLDLLVTSPPRDMSDEQVVAEILTYFPRMQRMPSFGKYETIHRYAKNVLPVAVAMEKQFPSTDHMITHYGMTSSGPNIWNTSSYFGGRYELTMQVPITINYLNNTFVVSGPLVVYLVEASECRRDGGMQYNGNAHRQFSEEEILLLIKSGWDWGVLNVSINPEPVKYFEIVEAMCRAPRYPIVLTKP